MEITSHPLRDAVVQELHARPYVRFSAPAHVLHFAFLVDEKVQFAAQAGLSRLKETLKLEPTYETERHSIYAGSIAGIGRLVVTWECHTECVSCTLFLYELEIPFEPFNLNAFKFLPDDFLDSFGTPLLVATFLSAGTKGTILADPEGPSAFFEGHTVNGSQVMAGQAEVWSSFRVHNDGFNRVALVVNDMSPRELGRTVQRLLTIEDSYHLTLLSLPLAREIRIDLGSWEARMVTEMGALRVANSPEQKRQVLDSFLGLAAEVENLRARASSRFAASAAYYSVLEEQLQELREEKIEHVLRLSSFLMRRLSPAARTYRSVMERLTNLAEHIDGAADLLRTGIDLNVEQQNQRLLESVNRRARLQLQLQHAVEGLSVVVLTYYSLGLLGYLFDTADHLGLHLPRQLVLGLAVVPLLLLYWGLVWIIRRRFHDRS